jgi:hypothetical protein
MTLTPSTNGLDMAHLMSRGLVACLRGGRRRVLSAINTEVARLYGPYVRLGPLAYVTGHKPWGSRGTPPERGAWGKGWTRVGPGPLFVSGFSWSWNLAKAQSLPGGTWGLPEGPGMPSWELRTHSHRGLVEVRTYQCTPGSLIFPCHVVLLALPHVVGLGAAPHVT